MEKFNKIVAAVFIMFIIALCSLMTDNCKAQWIARYNGPGNNTDEAFSIATDNFGNVYVTGFSTGTVSRRDFVTVKYNSAGDQQWDARYNGPGNDFDEAYSIAVSGSGDVYVTGYSYGGNSTGIDYATIKYNSAGDSVWVKRYSSPGIFEDKPSSIALDDSGNAFVTGYITVSGSNSDYATIKYNSAGIQQWVQIYNGPGNSFDDATSIAIDASGNVYVTGESYGSGTGARDYATVKYNSAGIQQWVKRYNGPGDSYDESRSITTDDSGNVYVTGNSDGTGSLNYDYATIKYNSAGDEQWISRYNGPGNYYDFAYSISADGSGNIYVTGGSIGLSGYYNYSTIKYNSAGVQQWAKRYAGPGGTWGDIASSIALDNSGNVYVTGNSNSGSGNISDYATIKYNSSGDSVWVKRYNGPGNSDDRARSIAADGSGNVYITGVSFGSGTANDYATIKNPQLSSGISQISSSIPKQFSLSQNYPNPFNPVTNLEFGISDLGFVSLKVYDILGKEIVTLVNEKLSPGNYKVEFDGSNLPSGTYFYRLVVSSSNPLTAGEFAETKTMLLVK